jgi:hypothetical protein
MGVIGVGTAEKESGVKRLAVRIRPSNFNMVSGQLLSFIEDLLFGLIIGTSPQGVLWTARNTVIIPHSGPRLQIVRPRTWPT